MKKIIFIIMSLVLLYNFSNFYTKGVCNESPNELRIKNYNNAVWIIDFKAKEIEKLLGIKSTKTYTFCLDMSIINNEAYIYFYSIQKNYKVRVKQINDKEFTFIYNNRKLRFVISFVRDNAVIGLKDSKGKLMNIADGKLYCTKNNNGQLNCKENSIQMCLKDAKETDDYYKEERELPDGLK